MDKLKVIFIGASCTIFAVFAYYNIRKLFGSGGDDPSPPSSRNTSDSSTISNPKNLTALRVASTSSAPF
jgi:hypothetical protein